MIAIDWPAVGLGASAGLVAGAIFFFGLALGMRLALRSTHPTLLLLLSSSLRLAGLLGVGWLIAQHSPIALAGFALGFVVVRFVAIAIARRPVATERVRWN